MLQLFGLVATLNVGCASSTPTGAIAPVVPLRTTVVLPEGGEGIAITDGWLAARNAGVLGGVRVAPAVPLRAERWLRDVQRLDSGRPHGTLQYGVSVLQSLRR